MKFAVVLVLVAFAASTQAFGKWGGYGAGGWGGLGGWGGWGGWAAPVVVAGGYKGRLDDFTLYNFFRFDFDLPTVTTLC